PGTCHDGRIRRVGHKLNCIRAGTPRTVAGVEGILTTIFVGEREIGATVQEIPAGGQREQLPCGIPTTGNTRLQPSAETLEILFHYKVDDAGYAIGAVDRRRSSGHHIDPFDEVTWDCVDIYGLAALKRGDMAP